MNISVHSSLLRCIGTGLSFFPVWVEDVGEAEADRGEDQHNHHYDNSGPLCNFKALIFRDCVFLLIRHTLCTSFSDILISQAEEGQKEYDCHNHDKLDDLGDEVHDPERFPSVLIVAIEHHDGPEDANYDWHDRFDPILLQKGQNGIDDWEDSNQDYADFEGTTPTTQFVYNAHFNWL